MAQLPCATFCASSRAFVSWGVVTLGNTTSTAEHLACHQLLFSPAVVGQTQGVLPPETREALVPVTVP